MNNLSYRIRSNKYLEGHEPGRFAVGFARFRSREEAWDKILDLAHQRKAEDPEASEVIIRDYQVAYRWTDFLNGGPGLRITWDVVIVDSTGSVIAPA